MVAIVSTGRRDVRRRLEQFAHNSRCATNVLSAVRDVPLAAVAKAAGVSGAVGQSPFAIARGEIFERSLFRDDALRLRRALVESKVLAANAQGFIDLRLARNSGPSRDLDESCARFARLLREWSASTGDARLGIASIVAGATVRMPAIEGLPEGLFSIDVITVHPNPRPAPIVLRVGEVKVFPDRGGFTDPAELSTARAQAGTYVHVLRLAITDAKLDREIVVADDGFLVFTRPGSNLPSIRAGEDLRFQADRARRALDELRSVALDSAHSTESDPIELLLRAPKSYSDACLSFCELASKCQREAFDAGIGNAMGEDMGRFLGAITLHRALELLRGAAPLTDAERDLQRRLR